MKCEVVKIREIKFRVWDKISNKIINVEDISDYFWEEIIRVYLKTLMQYTGLKDKYGRKIYEGDILKLDTENGRIRSVDWDEETSTYCMGQKKSVHNTSLWEFVHIGCIVIGNIYEDKELLEVKECLK